MIYSFYVNKKTTYLKKQVRWEKNYKLFMFEINLKTIYKHKLKNGPNCFYLPHGMSSNNLTIPKSRRLILESDDFDNIVKESISEIKRQEILGNTMALKILKREHDIFWYTENQTTNFLFKEILDYNIF